MLILILGPMLEEKYGTRNLMIVMLAAALVTGVLHYILFPQTMLMGASGVVFAFILLSSITGDNDGAIPLTFLLVVILYAGQQLHMMFSGEENISYLAHLVGGAVGAAFGFMMSNAIDIAAVIVATVVCWVVAAKNKSLGKVMGVIMVASYFVYMVYVVMRETGMM